MALGGISNVNNAGNYQGDHNSGGANESAGKEFSLEQQQAGSAAAAAAGSNIKELRKKQTSTIVDKKKRNRKGAPRTIIVDGEIYEVFLLAIA